MRLLRLGTAGSLFLLASQSFAASSADPFSKLPLRFEAVTPNQWIAHGAGFAVAFTPQGTQVCLGARGVRLSFEDSNPNARFQGDQKSAHPNNYFSAQGNHSADAFLRLRQVDVYPGIDVVYYGRGQGLEYDFELAPGADPSPIRMRFSGADRVSLNASGDVVLTLDGKEITQKAPVVYQKRASGEVVGVEASYLAEDDGSVRLKLGDYDRGAALVIDPQVLFQYYLLGSGSDVPVGIAHDKNNTIYIAGYTFSTDFLLAGTPYTINFPDNPTAVFVTVLNPLAATVDEELPYSGFFTGQFGDALTAMNVDNNGIVYLAGTTGDILFPVTANAFSNNSGSNNQAIFLASLDTTQAGTAGLLYSTFFGGSMTDQVTGIEGVNGLIYVTGFTTSTDFPVANGFQSTMVGGIYDAFVSVIDPSQAGTAGLIFSTYLGGTGEDIARSIVVAPDGQIWVAGETFSTDYPTTPTAYKQFYSGGGDAFLTRVDPNNLVITYSSYLGGSNQDQVKKILLDPQGRLALTGYTLSSDFPFTANALQPFLNGTADAFLTIIDPNVADFTKALIYSTFFGGSDQDVAYDMVRDASGKYYLCGFTISRDFPVLNALYPASASGGTDGWISVIDPSKAPAAELIYSSYVTSTGFQIAYGVTVDSNGVIYLPGSAFGSVFAPGLPAPLPNSNTNVFLLVFQLDQAPGQPGLPTPAVRKPPRSLGVRMPDRPSTR